MTSTATHSTAFAGLSGAMIGDRDTSFNVTTLILKNQQGNLLLDSTGRWAIRLKVIPPEVARMMLQILRDLAPPATQMDSTFIRQVAAFDAATSHDASLMTDIERGLAALDTLARKLTRTNGYLDIEERTLRRTLLGQMAELPLMERLGVRPAPHLYSAI